ARRPLGFDVDRAMRNVVPAAPENMDHVEGGAAAQSEQQHFHRPRPLVAAARIGRPIEQHPMATAGDSLETGFTGPSHGRLHGLFTPDGARIVRIIRRLASFSGGPMSSMSSACYRTGNPGRVPPGSRWSIAAYAAASKALLPRLAARRSLYYPSAGLSPLSRRQPKDGECFN